MTLLWTNLDEPLLPHLHRGMLRHCEIGRVVDPSIRPGRCPEDDLPGWPCVFKLLFSVQPNTRTNILRPGRYRLQLIATSKNSTPSKYWLEIEFNGTWYAVEQTMLTQGPKLQLVKWN